jgi:hypothetical protein
MMLIMKMIKSISSLFLLVILFYACSGDQSKSTKAQEQTVKDTIATSSADTSGNDQSLLLVPGKSAGKVNIGQNAEEVYVLFGKADAGDAAMQKSVAIWYKNHDPKSLSTSIYTVRDTGDNPAARIKQVRVTSPKFKTKENIGVSSTLGEIQNKYSVTKLTDVTGRGEVLEMYDHLAGIAFEVDSKGICKAIIIHSANEGLKPTSLPLR